VAGLTTGFLVSALEWKLGVLVMIEPGLEPTAFIMALLALFAAASLMYIVQFMAAVTASVLLGFRFRPFGVVVAGMALVATNLLVFSLETEFGVFVVVEFDFVPFLFAVTVLALLPETILVNVFYRMTGSASFRRVLVFVFDMA
jgi:hypothetical protein